MEIIFLSFIAALSYLIILSKMFGLNLVVKYQVVFDILFTFGLPIFFLGTFSGAATAFIAGIMFSMMTAFLNLIAPPKPKGTIL